jgi:hypothetical protein
LESYGSVGAVAVAVVMVEEVVEVSVGWISQPIRNRTLGRQLSWWHRAKDLRLKRIVRD